MIRILITILAITLSAPSASAASMMENGDMDWVGPTCCASESDTETEQSEIASACCCSLSPIHHGSQVSNFRLPSSDQFVAVLPAMKTIANPRVDTLTRTPRRVVARGPPRETLLSQHTLLQL
ncbi:MAG: hypothetical protein JKY56_14635 [Kofleriaceae bacterium]|nr:hypothetical protein [Kofleriaceae bacterium]